MMPLWQVLRWMPVAVVLGGSLWLLVTTVRAVPSPMSMGMPFEFWYGDWRAVLIVTGVFTVFVLGFSWPRRRAEWRNAGLYSAFLLSLFTEMFGLPLTIYL